MYEVDSLVKVMHGEIIGSDVSYLIYDFLSVKSNYESLVKRNITQLIFIKLT